VNLLLLEPEDFVDATHVRIQGRRAEHLRKILRAELGAEFRVGRVDGALGHGQLTRLEHGLAELEVQLDPDLALPPPSPVVLAFALCRPPTLAKVLTQASAMGVKRFEIFHCRRVEKSYWESGAMQPEALRREMSLGLEQCIDTKMPTIRTHRRFRPFAEDVLGKETPSPVRVADPSADPESSWVRRGSQTLVLGPEGGFIPFELQLFREQGFETFGLGPRILRVETAAVALLAQHGLVQ
jgi:RsmE family RNA methyltransferase